MQISLISLFGEQLRQGLNHSITARAQRHGIVRIDHIDPRRWAGGRHRSADDRPYGGGPGMVLRPGPIAGAIDYARGARPQPRLLLTSPQGRRLDQAWLRELSSEPAIAIVCGHYEGIDQRIIDHYQPELFSIGDYVLSGGELAAMVLVDGVVRLLPGALGDANSAIEDSFSPGADGGFDHPCYTRPAEWRGHAVPDALHSGDHARIEQWRAEQRAAASRDQG